MRNHKNKAFAQFAEKAKKEIIPDIIYFDRKSNKEQRSMINSDWVVMRAFIYGMSITEAIGDLHEFYDKYETNVEQ